MSRSPDLRKLSAVAALVSAGGAMAAEAVLVHDIAPPRPRYAQLAQMAAEFAAGARVLDVGRGFGDTTQQAKRARSARGGWLRRCARRSPGTSAQTASGRA
jgi:2-polyprenyl-3-methyl-5-hydroxy-6-metoxy-1,4-benzoquinol methylase